MPAPRTAKVLLVCSANVCRSPLAQFTLASALESYLGAEAVTFASAGTHGAVGAEMCALASDAIADADWRAVADRHRARTLTKSEIGRAHLVLTASRPVRSAVASLDPGARSKTFTLLEAATLGVGFASTPDVPLPTAIRELVQYMDSRRGHVPEASETKRWLRRPIDSFSIEDGHSMSPSEHRKTVRATVAASLAIANLLSAVPQAKKPAA